MEKSWEKNIRKVVPYVPGEQPKVEGELIKLNTNEFPYPPSPKVEEAIKNLPKENLRLYPNVTAEPLVEALSDYYGFGKDEIFVGVGSDDVLANCFLTFFNSDKPILFPDITYSFYDVWADLYKIPYRQIALTEEMRINADDYKVPNGGVVIANPNAPTGIGEGIDFIESIVAANRDSIVIVDEAYVDFGGETALPLVRKYDNVIVVRTFSKSRAFAGMRIGFAIANAELIKYLNDVKFSINSYTMNQTAIEYGRAIVADDEYLKKTVGEIIETREKTACELTKLGFTCLPSQTNFLFAKHNSKSGPQVYEYLKSKNIYVRHFSKPRIDDYLRITIGTKEQMEKLVSVLKEWA